MDLNTPLMARDGTGKGGGGGGRGGEEEREGSKAGRRAAIQRDTLRQQCEDGGENGGTTDVLLSFMIFVYLSFFVLYLFGCLLVSLSLSFLSFLSSFRLHFEGSQPEWCISSRIYSRDTPFWPETLENFVFLLSSSSSSLLYFSFLLPFPVLCPFLSLSISFFPSFLSLCLFASLVID